MKTWLWVVAALAVCLGGVRLDAADLTGTWQATQMRPDGQKRVTTYAFIVAGSKLRGYISSNQLGDLPIVDGRVEGDEFSFTVIRDQGIEQRKITYKGRVTPDGVVISGAGPELTAKRVSSDVPKELPPAKPKILLGPLQPVPEMAWPKRRPWAGIAGTSSKAG